MALEKSVLACKSSEGNIAEYLCVSPQVHTACIITLNTNTRRLTAGVFLRLDVRLLDR